MRVKVSDALATAALAQRPSEEVARVPFISAASRRVLARLHSDYNLHPTASLLQRLLLCPSKLAFTLTGPLAAPPHLGQGAVAPSPPTGSVSVTNVELGRHVSFFYSCSFSIVWSRVVLDANQIPGDFSIMRRRHLGCHVSIWLRYLRCALF